MNQSQFEIMAYFEVYTVFTILSVHFVNGVMFWLYFKGDQCSVIVDSSAPLSKVKSVFLEALKAEDIVPGEWPPETASSELNVVKLEYNKIRILCRAEASLDDERIALGTKLFVERAQDPEPEPVDPEEVDLDSKWTEIASLSPSYRRSPLAVLYEEQRVKMSVQFNEPLPAQTATERIEELLMTPQMLSRKRAQNADSALKPKLEFDRAVRVSRECPLGVLKQRIARELGLEMDAFRIKKSSRGAELRDLEQTLKAANIRDGGLVYVEHGVPTGPKGECPWRLAVRSLVFAENTVSELSDLATCIMAACWLSACRHIASCNMSGFM